MSNFINSINEKNPYDVIIIGAGAAGISASRELKNLGVKNQIILEARNYIGGRTYSDKRYGDLGAASFHIPEHLTGKSFQEIADTGGALNIISFALENNFKFNKDQKNLLVFIDGKMVSKGKVERAFETIESQITKALKRYANNELKEDISLYEILGKDQKRLVKILARTLFSTADSGLDLKKISLIDFLNTVSGTTGIYPDKGMGKLVKRYGKEIDNYVSLNKEVTRFFYDSGKNRASVEYRDLETGNIETIYAKKLVVTLPIGVLQNWNKENHNLPEEKIDAINKMKMGHLNKVILEMDERFFDKYDLKAFRNIIIRSSKLDEDLIFTAKPNDKPLLVAFIGGNTSLKLEKAGESAAINHALSVLKTAFSPKLVDDYFIGGKFTMWNKDKYSRGAYSSATIGNFDARVNYSKPIGSCVYFAGEAFYEPDLHLHTHVTGAIKSGEVVAHQVYQSLMKNMGRSVKS